MQRKATFLFAVCFSFAEFIAAQTPNSSFQIPVSSGNLDGQFVLPTGLVLNKEMQKLKTAKEKTTPEQENYIAEELSDLSKFLQGGSIISGDEMSNYVNSITKELLKGESALKGKLRVVITRNPVVNASVVDQGFVFVNIGMLAQVENESQLAFILGRQIALYREQHSMSRFKKRQQLIKEKKLYGDALREALREDSKQRQTAADRESIRLMKQAGYSLNEGVSTLDVLLYSYVPFDDVPFETAMFEDKNLKFPESYTLKETRAISCDEDFDDSNSSHPNIRKRKETLQTEIEEYKAGETERKKYLVSEVTFKAVQRTARYEVCRQYELKRNFPQAIYTAFLLDKKNPGDEFLQRIIAGSLYNLAVYRVDTNNTGNRSRDKEGLSGEFDLSVDNNASGKYYLPAYDKVEGQSQRVYYLINKMTPQENAAVAMNYAWKLHLKMPEDKYVSEICSRLFALMAEEHNLTMNSFSDKSFEVVKAVVKDTTAKEGSKYDKIKKQQSITDITGTENFAHYAFVDFASDTAFTRRFKAAVNYVEESKRNREAEQERKRKHEKVSLGIDKILVIDPLWADVTNVTNKKIIIAREKEQDAIGTFITATGKSMKLECVVLDGNKTDTSGIAAYNDYCAIKEMLSARMEHGATERTLTGQTIDCKKIIEKYGTSLCYWPCAITTYSLYSRQTIYYSILVDLEDGEWIYTNSNLEFKEPTTGKFQKHIKQSMADMQRRKETK